MNNSIVKLEDFELDEISGGVTVKQVAKKTGALAIKGTCSAVFGFGGCILSYLAEGELHYGEKIADYVGGEYLSLGKMTTINTGFYCVGGWTIC